ncbi:hypothetical protein [Parabacteroides sp. FAFU027]|uniref:hypothetical protein n=1 Tax=Parabacteroides sp. FAFU027 TaxID=2922715 RepID=UPI001FAE7684|nr:hypothetical protein [Parabacteroides sp. FAFU027]
MTWLSNIRVHLKFFFNCVDSESLFGKIFQSSYIYILGVVIVVVGGSILYKLVLYFFRRFAPFFKASEVMPVLLIVIALFYLNFFKSNYFFGDYEGAYTVTSGEGLKGEPSTSENKDFVYIRSEMPEESDDSQTRRYLFYETANFDGFESGFGCEIGLLAYVKTMFLYLIEQLFLLIQYQFIPCMFLFFYYMKFRAIDPK